MKPSLSQRSGRRSFWSVTWALFVGALLVVAVARADDKAPTPSQPAKKIQIEEVEKLRADKKCTVLDVRTPKEFSAGHIAGAVNIDIKSPDFEKKVEALDKDKPYIVHCARGGRSAAACEKMEKLGFKLLYDFSGGMNAWQTAGKPTEH